MAEKIVFHTPSGFMLRPFQEVLVRNEDDKEWIPGFFRDIVPISKGICGYRMISGIMYRLCIPYEGHEDFLGNNRKPDYPKPKREFKFGDKVRAWDDWEEDMLSIKRVGIFVCEENGAPYPYSVLDAETKRIVPFQYCEHADS